MALQGGVELKGTVELSGSKNESLALLAGSILTSKFACLTNVPCILDVRYQIDCLTSVGCRVIQERDQVVIEPAVSLRAMPVTHVAARFRGSILLLASLLARYGYAKMPIPGGCNIGDRPIQVHLKILERLGARVTVTENTITATARKLTGTQVSARGKFGVSVTGTCTALLAASRANGTTTITDCAREPEVKALVNALKQMGVHICGEGTSVVRVVGHQGDFAAIQARVAPDRIEGGTWLILAATLGCELTVATERPDELQALIDYLRCAGVTIHKRKCAIDIRTSKMRRLLPVRLTPYPGIPTDLHAPLLVFLAKSNHASKVTDTVFPRRGLAAAQSLHQLGIIAGDTGLVRGANSRHRTVTTVVSPDCRAAAALTIAALGQECGTTIIRGLSHLDRAYVSFDEKLRNLGAHVVRFDG